jgi:RNA polymerase sigma-70 factor (ECF subfamily)
VAKIIASRELPDKETSLPVSRIPFTRSPVSRSPSRSASSSTATFPAALLYYNIDMAGNGEQVLLRRVQKGDLDAYGVVIQEHQGPVFNVCLRILGNRQEAEDLTQEAFLRAYRNISHYDPERPFGPWMRTLAANLCYNHLQKASLERVPLEDERDHLPDHPHKNPEALLELSQEHRQLYRAIWQLPANQRVALELRHFQDLTYQEMAREMELPLNTIRSHLYRARRKLAELLEEENHD